MGCCKLCQIRLGPCCIGCRAGNCSRPFVINDITADIESEIRLFADDCVCYREIKDKGDTLKLQRDIDSSCMSDTQLFGPTIWPILFACMFNCKSEYTGATVSS